MAENVRSEPLAIPVSTTDTIPGKQTVRLVGPVFGVVARSMGFTKGVSKITLCTTLHDIEHNLFDP